MEDSRDFDRHSLRAGVCIGKGKLFVPEVVNFIILLSWNIFYINTLSIYDTRIFHVIREAILVKVEKFRYSLIAGVCIAGIQFLLDVI